jgi:aspartyl-tRNA(Asn)/glutamyl-tRNA(Gln) amidotransferase subunit A
VAFFDQPISDITRETQSNKRSCIDLVDKAVEAIAARDKDIHAFISIQPDLARKKAEILDDLSLKDKEKLPLLGIPVAVKDNICTKDMPTTCASRILENFTPPYNAAVIEVLEEAGAVIIGKTNLDEFAMGSSTETSADGITSNPHDLDYIPGGSSGGSAAAVASGFVQAALGSDTGGSIRQPCSHCGVAGLKPTYGRVSRYGLVAYSSSLDQIGPIAHDVRDLGLLLSVISKNDKRDSTYAGKPFEDNQSLYNGSVDGITVGIPKEYFGEGLSDVVRTSIENLVKKLSEAGISCIDVSLPNIKYAIAAYYIIATAEASSNLARYDGVKYGIRSEDHTTLIDMYKKTRNEGFGAEVKRRIMLGTYVLSSGYYDAYYLKAAKIRTLITNDFENAFDKCEAIISPVTPTPAFKLGEKCDDPLQMYLTDIYTVSANLAGIPGISIPCGKDGDLPIGTQFMAPKWKEDTLLKLAFASQTLVADS